VCWNPDVFGSNWNMPQILSRSGFTAFVTWRPPNEHDLFWWEGPDDSRILCYRAQSGYHHYLSGEQMLDFVQKEARANALGKELVVYGVGNHGGGPTIDMLEKATVVKNAPVYPDFKLATALEFFNSLTPSDKAKLPIWKNELYLPRLRGCYTTQALAKKHNRQSQVEISNVEKAATIAGLFGAEYPGETIFKVWRTILFNQFHDVLPGTSIPLVYQDSQQEYGEAHQLCERMLERSLDVIEKQIDTSGQGEALLMFNPLSWCRTSPVELPLDDQEISGEWIVLDEYGNAVPLQKVEQDALGGKLLFLAKEVPAYGYKVYRLVPGTAAPRSTELHFTRHHIDNEHLRIDIDQSTGLMAGIRDLANNRQVLASARGNLLQVFKDLATDAWNINYAEPRSDLDQVREVSLVELGPVRATIKVVHGFKGKEQPAPTEDFPTSMFTQYISLYDGLPFVEIRNHVMWRENHKVLKVAFPVNVSASTARYEIPYGSIERSTGTITDQEKEQIEVPAQSWADLSDGNYGVALINDCKHGYDIKGNVMRLTLLRAPDYPDVLADRGYHDFKYALLPHQGDSFVGEVPRRSFEFNEPLLIMRTGSHKGMLAKSASFVQIEPANVILNSLKKAEDDDDWILRVFEIAGKSADVKINFSQAVAKAAEVNLIEDHLADMPHQAHSLEFGIKPNEIRSFKVKFKKQGK
jgi:alpha-mannosidase